MDVETIEYSREFIRIECDIVRLIGLGCICDRFIEARERLDERLIVRGEYEIFIYIFIYIN